MCLTLDMLFQANNEFELISLEIDKIIPLPFEMTQLLILSVYN